VLLAGAGLMIQSIMNFASAPLGFQPDRLLVMQVNLPPQGYSKLEQRIHFYDLIKSRVGTLPGIEEIGLTTRMTLRGSNGLSVVNVEGRPPADPKTAIFDTEQQAVSDGYFGFLGIPIRTGREFVWTDRGEKAPVAVVNEAVVRKYFPGEDPIGKRIRFPGAENPNPWLAIVGVVADEKQSTPFQEMAWVGPPIVYRALAQQTNLAFNLVVRSSLPTTGIQHEIESLDPEVRISNVETMPQVVSRYLAYPRFRAALMGGFAALGLLLAVVGLFGVLSQIVGQRTQEIGIRIALGAQRSQVLAAVVKEGMLLVAVGGVLGFVATGWLTRFLGSLLYGVQAQDPATLIGVALLMIAAGLLAAYLPARRAASVDPIVSLRCQ
jgi:predicted permease